MSQLLSIGLVVIVINPLLGALPPGGSFGAKKQTWRNADDQGSVKISIRNNILQNRSRWVPINGQFDRIHTMQFFPGLSYNIVSGS